MQTVLHCAVTWKLSSAPWCLKTHEAELDTPAVAGHPARADHHGRNILVSGTPGTCSCTLAPRVRWGSRSHRAGRNRRGITGTLGRRDLAHATSSRKYLDGWDPTLHCAKLSRTEAHVTYQRKPYLNGADVLFLNAGLSRAHPRALTSFTDTKITVQMMKSTTSPKSCLKRPWRATPGRCGARK
jgi:hypothetical protein